VGGRPHLRQNPLRLGVRRIRDRRVLALRGGLAGLDIADHLHLEVLRRPIESAQYLSIRYTERLAEAGAVASVGSKGDSYDNALAESFNGLFKTELIHRRGPWKSAEDLEWATLTYIDWFNNRRLHGEIGMRPPAELEATHYRQDEAALRAVSQPTEPLQYPGRLMAVRSASSAMAACPGTRS
jgi:putative transposase